MNNIGYFSFRLSLSFTFGAALMLFQTSLPAQAQTGNQSDVTGAIVTTSDITGGTFTKPSVGGNVQVVFSSYSVQVVVNDAALEILRQLNINSLTSPDGNPIPFETQQTLLSVLTASRSVQGNANDRLTNSLSSVQSGSIVNQAQQLVNSLQGLLTIDSAITTKLADVQFNESQLNTAINTQNAVNIDNFTITPIPENASLNIFTGSKYEQGNPELFTTISTEDILNLMLVQVQNVKINPTRLMIAVKAYNNLIDNSSAQFLNNPPPELLAVQSVLSQLIKSL
ncbi:MAG: hypothetical protein V7L31_28695 [Nostoc sp.]|uniref:hypothetical protein n=1 Tax=Nostoc sp. TaxID=1180 RepID=UPI002FF2991A